MEQVFEWQEPGRESLHLKLTINDGEITQVTMKTKGCLEFLAFSQKMKEKLKGPVRDLLPPSGKDHSSIIWREMVARIQGDWKIPFEHAELCHCRKITTERVDRAVVYGAHTVDEIRHRTSANTGCGTCKPDVESMIANRLNIK